MCGIAGFVDFSGHDRDAAALRVKCMTDALVHRGPDAEGRFVDGHAALGHRRLSIIDIAGGQQPMGAAGGAVQVVFNGEIYNFEDLRRELQGRGHEFRTRSDTEVILAGYLEWGDACVERLNGMFAFAIWDARAKRLTLARDRVGKKPLYLCRQGTRIAFASELKALRAAALCADEIDPESLDCYFTLGYVPAPRTIYRGVRKLPAAHLLTADGNSERERAYWTLSFGEPRNVSLHAAVDEFEALLDDAVRCRLVSEVPLGAFLSGGLDSSLVVSTMSRLTQGAVITNAIGFDDRKQSELDIARATASRFGTRHHEYVVRPEAAAVLPRIAWHLDDPVADSSALPTWYVCEMARRSVTVALSGDGGDEMFGGYTFRYLPHVLESRIRRAIPVPLRAALFGLLGCAWPASARLPRPLRLKTILENLATGDAEAYYRDLAWLRDDIRRSVYGGDFTGSLKGFTARETVHPYYRHSDAPDALGRAQFTDIQVYMTDDVLAKVDRISMAHSLEIRCPLLDHRIAEFAARLPSSLKVGARRGKLVLRGLAARRLAPEVLDAPKRGFSIPAARWLRGELRPMAQELVLSGNGLTADVLDASAVRRIWDEHQQGARDHSVFLWGLMMLEMWRHVNRSAAGAHGTAAGAD